LVVQHTDGGGASFLYSESAPEVPRRTTLFASGAAAYDALPVELQREAESVVLHYSNKFVTGDTATVDYLSGARMAPNGLRLAQPAAPCVVSGRDRPPLKVEPADARAGDYVPGKGDHSRPLVRVHPVSGRKVLWATPKNMETISVGGVELGVEESRAKLEQLMVRKSKRSFF
jgi:alpha-ketoglutarate-dependent taurine dioxygenase